MGYADHFPSWNGPKKPLTKEQLRNMQKKYETASKIIEHVKDLEKKDTKKSDEFDQKINSIFL